MSPRARLLPYLLSFAILIMAPACVARAEAIVSGTENQLAVEVRDTNVQDVLAILADKFGLRYHGLSAAGRPIVGTYAGSLRTVVTRLLDGYDYVMKVEGGRIEVFVLGVARRNEAGPGHSQTVSAPTRRRSD